MVESTVSSANETGTDIAAGAMVEVQQRMQFTLPRPLIALWLVLTALILGFVALGAVRIGAGNWAGQRMRVSRVWAHFLDYLSQQGASAFVQGVVAMLAIVAVLGGCALIWSAMAVRGEPGPEDIEDAAPR